MRLRMWSHDVYISSLCGAKMATGGVDPDLDHRRTCSICLESFRGRHPKLLPCFHTFCLTCLRQLTGEDTQQLSLEGPQNKGERTEGETTKRRTLICPTCRAVTPVPPGGVAYMQKNFYLENSDEEESLPAPACDLCDGEQTARYSCTKCPNKVCSQCRRYHDKFCQATGLMEINLKQTRDGSSVKKDQQIQLVEKVLKTLRGKKDRLAQESEKIENKIHGGHATVLRLLNETRNASLKAVKTSTELMADMLGREVDEANSKLRQLQRRGSGQSANSQDVQLDVLSEADVQHYQDVLKEADEEILLEYKLDDTTMCPLLNSLSDFVRTVAQTSLGLGLTSASEFPKNARAKFDLKGSLQQPVLQETEHSSADNQDLATFDAASNFDQLCKEFAEYKKLFAVMQTDNAALHKDMETVTAKNTSLCATIATLEKEAVKRSSTCEALVRNLQTDMDALHQEMTNSSVQNSSLCIAIETLEKTTEAHKKTSTELAECKRHISDLHTDNVALQKDMAATNAQCFSLCATAAALGKQTTAIVEASKVFAECKKLAEELQIDNAALHRDVMKTVDKTMALENEMVILKETQPSTNAEGVHALLKTNLEADISTLQNDVAWVKGDLGQLLRSSTHLNADMTLLKTSVTTVQTAVASLENKFAEANTMVAFHAKLEDAVATKSTRSIIICDKAITNVGNSYNKTTGIFTAPVPGIYCFMVTTSPRQSSAQSQARLDVMLESRMIGYVFSREKEWSTCHAVAKVCAGEQVTLRSYSDQDYVFHGRWWTTFSGMLLQRQM